MKRTISLWVMGLFYLLAGINHFRDPSFYLPLIPDYLPWHEVINWVSGIAEIVLAIGIVLPTTRKFASMGIIAMLILFIPSHVYFIQIGGCIQDGLCAPLWVGWVRLIVVHPLLIYWAWSHRR